MSTTGEWAHAQPPQYATDRASALVEMITPPLLPPSEESIVKPTSVTVIAELEGRVVCEVVIDIEDDVEAVALPKAPPLISTYDSFPTAKNPEENINVMFDPGARAPPTDGVNENVTAAMVLPAIRPMPAIINNPSDT